LLVAKNQNCRNPGIGDPDSFSAPINQMQPALAFRKKITYIF